MEEYKPEKIEPKWQQCWEKGGLYKAEDFSKKPKLFLLVEFPYPSGAGLHVGHCRSYTAMDIIARKRRMEGYNVLYPMGWDAFGLPTENYAIKTKKRPSIATKENIETFKKQEKALGLSFDWQREINTTDPKYYKWTQWLFLKLFENGLAYKAKMPINWCLSCKIGLANEEVVEGRCERCSGEVEKREKEQWMLKITDYADRLLKDLELVDFPERVKKLQEDWVGKSKGWEITFNLKSKSENLKTKSKKLNLKVFTTRVDTLFGCTYMVISPEHPIIDKLRSKITSTKEVEEYIEKAKKKADRERLAEVKDKTGVKLEGVTAVNPANNKEIPIFIADYVLMDYGTGVIMAVPAHDQRDFDFAKKYRLDIKPILHESYQDSTVHDKDKIVFATPNGESVNSGILQQLKRQAIKDFNRGERSHALCHEGFLFDSGDFNGLHSSIAREKIGQWLKKKGLAEKKVNYKLRDWVFSRQRYWGEPIPLVYCKKCGWQTVSEDQLPVELPDVKDYKPTDKGESPLASVEKWVNTKCPKCKGKAKRETDVMPNWAGSNWYFMRYCDPKNNKKFADEKKLKYWMPVDWYNGGMEHTTLHLLYSRFIYKFLWDISEAPKELGPEPYKKRTSHGMVLAQGGVKMSKSKGNVVNPDDVIKQYGADTLRVYEMFMGPFNQAIAWDTEGIKGSRRFLEKAWKLSEKRRIKSEKLQMKAKSLEKLLHQTIKKVSEDIEKLKFNTAVSALMVLVNAMENEKELKREYFETFLLLLSPFAPHIAEELRRKLSNPEGMPSASCGAGKKSIFQEKWPKYDPELAREENLTLVVQVNGRVRDKIETEAGLGREEAEEKALNSPKIKQWLQGRKAKKVIFVKDKLVNFVV